jgi:hypothetical protein
MELVVALAVLELAHHLASQPILNTQLPLVVEALERHQLQQEERLAQILCLALSLLLVEVEAVHGVTQQEQKMTEELVVLVAVVALGALAALETHRPHRQAKETTGVLERHLRLRLTILVAVVEVLAQ